MGPSPGSLACLLVLIHGALLRGDQEAAGNAFGQVHMTMLSIVLIAWGRAAESTDTRLVHVDAQ